MGPDLPSSDCTTSASKPICFSEDSQATSQETFDETNCVDDEGLLHDPSTYRREAERQATISHASSTLGVESTGKSAANTLSEIDGTSAPTKYDILTATLADLHSTQVNLIRQLERHMILKSRTNPDKSESTTSSETSLSPLPSTVAHTISHPPLRPEQSTEAMAYANSVIQEHIRLLQQYNQIRDIGQGLIGIIADKRKVRVKDCQEEFGVTNGD